MAEEIEDILHGVYVLVDPLTHLQNYSVPEEPQDQILTHLGAEYIILVIITLSIQLYEIL